VLWSTLKLTGKALPHKIILTRLLVQLASSFATAYNLMLHTASAGVYAGSQQFPEDSAPRDRPVLFDNNCCLPQLANIRLCC
jgi:hypothetical protein